MAESDFRSRWRRTGIWLGLLIGMNLIVWAVLVLYAPVYKKRFDEHGLWLPGPTRTVIQVSDWFARYWYAATPTLISAMAVGVLAGRHLFRRPTAGTVFAGFCLSALVAALIVTALALALAEIKLAQWLNK